MGVFNSANGINSNVQRAVGSILEAHGEREPASQLTMKLGLGGSRTHGADGEQISQELGGDGIQHLAGNGHALIGQVDEQLAGDPETLVDLERVVDIRVVDEALPADCGTWFFKVGSHHDHELVLVFFLQDEEPIAVVERGFGVVDGAWSDDD